MSHDINFISIQCPMKSLIQLMMVWSSDGIPPRHDEAAKRIDEAFEKLGGERVQSLGALAAPEMWISCKIPWEFQNPKMDLTVV